jgi:malonate transporter
MSTSTVLVSLFFVMLVGVIAGKCQLFDDRARKAFSKFVFYIGTSAIIIQSLVDLTPNEIHGLPRFTIFNSIFYMAITVAIYLALRLLKVTFNTGAVMLYAGTAANTVYIGLPIVRALYGGEGVVFTVVLLAIPTTFADLTAFYLIGRWRNSKESSIAKTTQEFLRNPLVISTAVGVLLLIVGLHFPNAVDNGLTILGDTTSGVALFAMGLFLSTSSWQHFKLKSAIVASALKLLIVPALAYWLATIGGLTGAALAVTVLLASMPSAVFCIVVATEYEFDERATADTILLSSVLFLATSAIWIRLVR